MLCCSRCELSQFKLKECSDLRTLCKERGSSAIKADLDWMIPFAHHRKAGRTMSTLSSVLSTYLCKNWDKWLI